jgi:di- and tripeptidase
MKSFFFQVPQIDLSMYVLLPKTTQLLKSLKVWDAKRYHRLHSIYSTYDIGDIFCVAYCSSLNTLYLGGQNASIQVWFSLLNPQRRLKRESVDKP